MTYEELIEEAGAAIGIEGFAPDADGICMLVSDIGEIVIMNCKGTKEMVLLNAAVTDVPHNAGERRRKTSLKNLKPSEMGYKRSPMP